MTEIVAYELHVKTRHSLSDMLMALKTKGIEPDLEKECGYDLLKIKHPKGSYHEFEIRLESKGTGYRVYEVKARTKHDMELLEEAIKTM